MGDLAPARPRRARWPRLVVGQVRYAHREFWRSPVMAFVTLGFPLAFLFMLGIAYQDAPPDPVTGSAAIQTVAPVAAVFAAVMAAYVMLPYGISRARERGVLKRLRGTPLPVTAYLAGRTVTAVVVALLGTTLMLTNGVTAFDLAFPWGRLPALLVTFIVGVACFVALGFAVAMLLPTSNAVMTFTLGTFFVVSFASGTFGADVALPRLLELSSWVFPVRHFSVAFGDVFDPTASAFGWSHLAALAAWGAVGAVVGWRRWSVDPAEHVDRPLSGRTASDATSAEAAPAAPSGRLRRAAWLSWRQARHANRQMWRDRASAFFVVAFPVLFVVVVPYAFGQPVVEGVPLAALVTPAMAVFGLVVAAYVNMPEAVAIQREQGVLKRLRGTPLPAAAYVAGRVASVVWITALAVAAVFVAGWLLHDVPLTPSAWPALALTMLVGAVAMAALGLTVVALVPDAKTVPAVSLGTFIPLAFVSDLLAFGVQLPDALSAVGRLFPLKHLAEAVDTATRSEVVAWGHLLFVLLWGLAGAAVATWQFRWAPRRTTP